MSLSDEPQEVLSPPAGEFELVRRLAPLLMAKQLLEAEGKLQALRDVCRTKGNRVDAGDVLRIIGSGEGEDHGQDH